MRETVRKFKETVEIRSSIFNRVRSHRYFPATLLFVVLLLAACVHIWQRVKVVELVKEVAELKDEQAELRDAKKKIRSDIATLSTAARIEQYAVDSLGLQRVDAERLFTLVFEDNDYEQPDDLELLLFAINRMADAVPTFSENNALARGVENLKLDSLTFEEAAK